ncbi:MAG: DNA polymerase II large subunit [Candidatus Bathyarchaeia archaeon]
MKAEMSRDYKQYVTALEKELTDLYEIAEKAREKGFDPDTKPESRIAEDLAELVEGLVGPKHVSSSIRELADQLPREELAFKVAEQIVYGKFGHMKVQQAAEQAVRTALGILTEGITAAPLQGVSQVLVKENFDNSKYLAIYYAGPIRSAGGTDQALTLVIADFVRKLLGLSRYRPTEEEINRFIEEIRTYERNVPHGRFQYHVTDSQLRFALESIPVEVTGIESDPVEVQTFRNLPRIETNCVRGGALRVLNDGAIGRAAKVYTIVKKLGIEGWDWLQQVGDATNPHEEKSAGFLEDVIAGRPVFSFPSKPGGFRLRYGRARNTGLSAVGVHPSTMTVLKNFLAAGTQMRLELPGKGGIVMPVDSISPPTVLLKDGSVILVTKDSRVKDGQIDKILSLGDLLVSFGDFLYNNRALCPSGYTEEWWAAELKEVVDTRFHGDFEAAAKVAGTSVEHLAGLLRNPYESKPDATEAIMLSKTLFIPLHPMYSPVWSNITPKELGELRHIVCNSKITRKKGKINRIILESNAEAKSILERLYLPHNVDKNKIVVEDGNAVVLAFCLNLDSDKEDVDVTVSTLEAIRHLSNIPIRAKAPTTVGARMGRPEKAKRREMKPTVHLLFPVGLAGGSQRDLIVASKKGMLHTDLVDRYCPQCQSRTLRSKCSSCHAETVISRICPRCGKTSEAGVCRRCNVTTQGFRRRSINLKEAIKAACNELKVNPPRVIKGVKGLSNKDKIPEALAKGIMRAREDLSVYKDGTTRFDSTNAPLTHFKPSEIGVSVEVLRQLGYHTDFNGDPLQQEEQICELKMQDIVIPRKNSEYFLRVARFLDELLEKLYGQRKLYDLRQEADLVGHLVIGLAPHTCVGILGRIIGFTELSVCYAHPLWHSAKRRDCDGDEDTLILAIDVLLNFSQRYLPSRIGGIMDAPLFIIPAINPTEVQRQAHELDVASGYCKQFYDLTQQSIPPWKVTRLVDLVADRLGTEAQFEGFRFTTPVSDINMGNRRSMYKKIGKMTDKLKGQLALADRIVAVDARGVALKVLTTHFLRDISGNLRAFTTQGFRCRVCNKRLRRISLKGKCPTCGGVLSLTVYQGGIEKYIVAARFLVDKYKLPAYYHDRISLIEAEINSLFEGKKPKQVELLNFT